MRLKDAFRNYCRQRRGGQWIDFPADGHPEEDMMDALRGGIRDAMPDGGVLKPEYPPNARLAADVLNPTKQNAENRSSRSSREQIEASRNTVQIARTISEYKASDVLVPTLCVGTPFLDALRL